MADEPDELLSFTTAVREADTTAEHEGNQVIRFELDGEEMRAVRPKNSAFMFLSTSAARTASLPDKINAVATFLDAALDEPSSNRIHHRLMDNNDPLELEDLLPVLEAIVGRWTGGKSDGPRNSSAGRRSTGTKRTAPAHSKALTS